MVLSKKPGIQAKISIFITIVIVSVLSVFTYMSRTLTEQKAEENLKERYVNIVKQIDSGIVTAEELHDTLTLQEELTSLVKVRPNIVLVEIFELTGDKIRIAAGKGAEYNNPLTLPAAAEISAIKDGEVIARLDTKGNERVWNILAPIRINKNVAGLILAKISTKEFDSLVYKERQQAFIVTGITALTILIFLVLYLRRTISKPIKELISAMSGAEGGDLGNKVLIHSNDEIGRLAEQFNKMIHKIRDFNNDLKTEIQQATEKLNNRYEELISANKRLSEVQLQLAHSERLAAAGQVAAAMAHRIGTPLHSISGHLHRLKSDTSVSKQEERILIIESQIDRIVQSVQELLNSVRKPQPIMEMININNLFEELFNLVSPGMSSRGIKVITRLEPGLPAVKGDVILLQEAFLNLFTNAMDAMPDGGELHVKTEFEASDIRDNGGDKGNDAIIVKVTDSGSGIAESDLPKIFDPFFTTKGNNKGTGLGLSIFKDNIKSHGFRVQVFSNKGAGTTFAITMPVNRHE